MTDIELIKLAKTAAQKAYVPYSHFNVGAALQTKEGKIYLGYNIENAAYTPTICAERVAIFKAVSEGERNFEKIAIIGGLDCNFTKYSYPCGVCRQVMSEFCDDNFLVLIAKSEDDYLSKTLDELLPYMFKPQHLEKL